MIRCAVLVAGLLSACAPKGPQRPPDLEAAYARLQREPGRAEPYLELARLYLRRGDYLRARQYLAVADQLPVRDARAAFRLAVTIAVRSEQYDEAIARCRRQLEHEESTDIRLLMASLLEATGRWSEAERERRLVLQARPQDLHQIIEMARFYQRSGQPDANERAAALYRRYLELAPQGDEAPQARAALSAISLSEAARQPEER
ncbi:MAG: hypothetical protein RMK29_12360 [Myxococcales bacterium]|nr:hypothetical protein [Myxococcota bacterium]MDW8282498.1 hypothetical protein [Myxococcales bacterium]